MDFDPLLRPRGPLPSATYWLRRSVLILAVLLVVLVVARSCGGGAATVTSAPSPSVPAATIEPPSPSPSASCQLDLSVATNQKSYATGEKPRFTVTVRNAGPAPCPADPVTVAVLSGADKVWSSADCQATPDPSVTPLPTAGDRQVTVNWSRTPSALGCAIQRQEVDAGTYTVVASIGGQQSPPTSFVLG